MMNLYSIQNLVATEVTECNPSRLKPADYSRFEDKAAFQSYCRAPDTVHCFYNGFRGKDPAKRVSQNNPAVEMQALVVDVDEALKEEVVLTWINSQAFKPSCTSHTFSGKWRLLYNLEYGFPRPDCDWPAFLEVAYARLGLASLSQEVDDCFFRPGQYYELGRDWTATGNPCLRTAELERWAEEAAASQKVESDSFRFGGLGEIERLVHQEYPGRWAGEFKEGARGVRFWIPEADNPTAAMVKQGGMLCFTGPERFVPWDRIFGTALVAALKIEHFKMKLPDLWFDGSRYWFPTEGGGYEDRSREDMGLHLRVAAEFCSEPRGNSELDQALLFLQHHRRVKAVAPFLYRPQGLVEFDNERYLNTSKVKPIPPADGARAWGEGFPYVAAFYDRMFPEGEGRDVMLAWIRHFYKGAVAGRPDQGHAMIIVGEPACGKNFHSEVILGQLMGGSVDAAAFITGSDTYNNLYLASPLMRVDDAAGIGDSKAHRKYTATIKKLVANRQFTVSEKYIRNGKTEWMGRVIVTLNPDGESLDLLPSLDQSNRDKICFLRTGPEPMPHPPEGIAEQVANELPAFGRWLLDWQPPAWLTPGVRFGFTAYQDPNLLSESMQNSEGAQFEELLILFARQCGETETLWEGTASELLSTLSGNSSVAGLIQGRSAVYVGRQLGKLTDRPYLGKTPRGKARGWRIDLKLLRDEWGGE